MFVTRSSLLVAGIATRDTHPSGPYRLLYMDWRLVQINGAIMQMAGSFSTLNCKTVYEALK